MMALLGSEKVSNPVDGWVMVNQEQARIGGIDAVEYRNSVVVAFRMLLLLRMLRMLRILLLLLALLLIVGGLKMVLRLLLRNHGGYHSKEN